MIAVRNLTERYADDRSVTLSFRGQLDLMRA